MKATKLLQTTAVLILAALFVLPWQYANAQEKEKKVEKKVRVMKKKADHDSAHNVWFNDGEEKEVKVTIDDGRRIVVINGDTVSVDECDPDCEDPPFFVRESDRRPHSRMMWHSDDGPFGYLFGELADKDGALFLPDFDIDIDIPHLDLDILRFQDQELREMERKSRELAREARRAEGEERAALETKLEAELEAIFELKQERSEERLMELKERLAESRERLEKRSQERERIIEKRKNELLGEHDYMEW